MERIHYTAVTELEFCFCYAGGRPTWVTRLTDHQESGVQHLMITLCTYFTYNSQSTDQWCGQPTAQNQVLGAWWGYCSPFTWSTDLGRVVDRPFRTWWFFTSFYFEKCGSPFWKGLLDPILDRLRWDFGYSVWTHLTVWRCFKPTFFKLFWLY